MKILSKQTIDLEEVADLCAAGITRPPAKPRDHSCFHVSNLLESARLIAKGEVRYHEYEGEPKPIMSWGRIWEAAVDCYLLNWAKSQSGVYIPDVETNCQGIIASLDGLLHHLEDAKEWMVVEIKLRFTQNGEIPLSHIQQMRAYCYTQNTDLVLYVVGHISSRPPEATATMTTIQFTRESIQETWEGILNTKHYLEEKGCLPLSQRVAKDIKELW